MISKEAVKEFLKQPRESYTWIKDASREDLEESIKELCPQFQPKLPLFTHQLASVNLGLAFNNFLYLLDMGLGKTRIALNIAQCRKLLRQVKRTLVVVPNLVNIESWLEEVEKFTDLKAVGLVGTKAERLLLLKQPADIYVINYSGLPIFTTDFKETRTKKGIKKKRTLNSKSLRLFALHFEMLVFDELHHVKHTDTLTYKICEMMSRFAKYRLGLTGTPIGRDPQNFWAQFHIVDRGETLGTNKQVFLQALFTQQMNHWGSVNWVLPKKNEKLLHEMLLNRSIRYEDNECSDLPPVTIIDIPLVLPADTAKMYQNLVAESIDQARSSDSKTKKNYYSKTRQVASGFMYDETEDGRVVLQFSNPKLEALQEILEDVPMTSKVVIFHLFDQSGMDIIKLLKKMRIKHATMNSAAEDGKVVEYKKFKTDPNVKVLVVSIASGGEGLNLQNANYCIFYEPVDRPDVYRQALKRCHRIGQTQHTYIYQFIVKKTVEMKIMEFIKEGKYLFQALVDGKISNEDAFLGL